MYFKLNRLMKYFHIPVVLHVLEVFWEWKSLEYLRLDRTIQNLIQAERYCRFVVLFLRRLVVELNSFRSLTLIMPEH